MDIFEFAFWVVATLRPSECAGSEVLVTPARREDRLGDVRDGFRLVAIVNVKRGTCVGQSHLVPFGSLARNAVELASV